MTQTKVVVIGGGIAGVSAAYALSQHRSQPSVTLIEAEAQLAHHTTGRSAAQFIENYGTMPTRVLTKASLPFFTEPPEGLTDGALLQPRGLLTVARPEQTDHFEQVLAEGQAQNPSITEISPDEAVALFPLLRPELVARALLEPDSADIDVAGLHQAFVRGLARAGGAIDTSQRAVGLARVDQGWDITTADTTLGADIIVNAAGAWGDEVGAMAGLRPLGLRPLRRTAFMVPAPVPGDPHEPLVADIEHHWYTKRDGEQYLCSPADETLSEPCDAKPEEIDIALAIDLINAATSLGIRTVRSSWAGLRTFSPDDTMVLGPDPEDPSFVWCVGQGGVGIQTSPATGFLVADLTLDGRPGPTFDHSDIDVEAFDAGRFSSPRQPN
ncbi:MAG: FAD-binding oxidoreductase [Actinomycetia bacterium]|nr:FAD-binding oxidoreductase [Actinomycetes bacterium]MCP5032608.1 FAD-binding oxidoreductase [Actinomycetes bacterium]